MELRKSIIYIGLDVSKNFTVAAAITEKGELIKQAKLSNFKEEWYSFFDKLSKNSKLQIAFEASSMLRKFFDELSKYGEVKVAHPAKVKLIAETKLKTDRRDSLAIAKLLRLNELPEVYVCKDEEILKLRALTRERQRLKQIAARFKCQIRHLLLQNGIILEGNIFTKEKREVLKSYCIEEIDRRLSLIEKLEEEISIVNERIKEIIYSRFTEEIAILTSIPGIGFYTASLLIAEIADIKRFPSFRKLACYSGLIPSMYQSAKRLRYGRITRQGNKHIRWVLVEAANIAIKMDKRLKAFYERIARKKGHNKAIVALAKKLLRISYSLLKRNEAYRSIA